MVVIRVLIFLNVAIFAKLMRDYHKYETA
jgi:hypothetical protein